MSKNLYVGRLPFDFTDEKLRALFAGSGTVVSAAMVPDPKNGRSRGFGFVTMSTVEESQAAIAKINGSPVGGKEIWVTLARPRAPRESKESPTARPSSENPRFLPRSSAGGKWFSGRPSERKPGSSSGSPRFPTERGPRRSGPSDARGRRSPGGFSGRPGSFDRFRRDPASSAGRESARGSSSSRFEKRGPRSEGFRPPHAGSGGGVRGRPSEGSGSPRAGGSSGFRGRPSGGFRPPRAGNGGGIRGSNGSGPRPSRAGGGLHEPKPWKKKPE